MATKEEAAAQEFSLLTALSQTPEKFSFLIPNWPVQDSQAGLTWMRHALWEGFYVSHKIDQHAKRVYLKSWEFGEDEPDWGALAYDI